MLDISIIPVLCSLTICTLVMLVSHQLSLDIVVMIYAIKCKFIVASSNGRCVFSY